MDLRRHIILFGENCLYEPLLRLFVVARTQHFVARSFEDFSRVRRIAGSSSTERMSRVPFREGRVEKLTIQELGTHGGPQD